MIVVHKKSLSLSLNLFALSIFPSLLMTTGPYRLLSLVNISTLIKMSIGSLRSCSCLSPGLLSSRYPESYTIVELWTGNALSSFTNKLELARVQQYHDYRIKVLNNPGWVGNIWVGNIWSQERYYISHQIIIALSNSVFQFHFKLNWIFTYLR